MKYAVLLSFLVTAWPVAAPAAEKLTEEDRVEILRGMMAEYATAKVILPRSRKPLKFESKGTYDKVEWADAGKEFGPAARVGDLVQITKVDIDSDKIVFEINGGLKTKKKWYERIEVGMGGSGNTSPVGGQGNGSLAAGTSLALVFDNQVPVIKASEIKKLLAPILDFEKRSATEHYVETLPEPVKEAIAQKKAIVGMDREQVLLAMGRPVRKSRETKDGIDYEDWVYGQAPGRITFVTFQGAKVVKVKESYAGLGGSTVETPPVP
jgi:hypothetical protein